MSKIEDIADTKFDEILERVQLDERNVVDSRTCIYEQQDVGGAVGRRLGSSRRYIKYVENGMPWWEVLGTATSWMDLCQEPLSAFPLMGVVIVLFDHAHQLFTYPNISFIRTNF